MEWIKIGDEVYEICSISTQFSIDQKHLNSSIIATDEATTDKILELHALNRTFDFETKKWSFVGTRIKSLTIDGATVQIDLCSSMGGIKSVEHERDKRIDELLGSETSGDPDDIITN